MTLAVTTMPNAVAPAAHSSTQGANRSGSPQTNTAQTAQSSLAGAQAASVVSFSSSDKSRTTSSRPNERVDKNFESEKKKANHQKEDASEKKRLNISV
jgi:hypothetical protein